MSNNAKNNDTLNKVFDDGIVLHADLPELKRLLLACTEMREADILNTRVKEGLPKRTDFIKLLIQLKEREITHGDLMRRSSWTLVVAIATFIVLAIKTTCEILSTR